MTLNITHRSNLMAAALVSLLAFATTIAQAQTSRYDELANLPFKEGYIAKDNTRLLLDDLFFQRGVQTYALTHDA